MPPEEVERRREEYRQSRPIQPRSQPMTPEERAAARIQHGLGTGVVPEERAGSGGGYDFGALAEGLGISGLLDTAKQVGQDVFMGGYSAEELLNKTMPTRMEALGEGRGLMDLDEYEQGAVFREGLTAVPKYLQSILSPNPENERLGTATLGGMAEAVAPRAKGFLGLDRGEDETPEELIANGPTRDAIRGRLTLPLPGGGADTDTGFTSPITAVADGATPQEAKVEEAAGIEAFDSDVSGGAAASIATGTVTEVEDPITELVASSGGNTASSGFQAQLDAVIARQNDPMRAITTFLRGMGEGETIGEGMQIAGKALESARRANDAEQIELLKLLEAGRISEQDFELKRLQIQNEKNQIIEYRENSKRVLQAAQSRVAASVSAALMSQYQDVFQDVADREAMSQTLLQQAENEAAREVGGVPRFGGINKLNKDPAFTDLVNKKLTILMETAIAAQLQKASSYAGRP